MENTKGDIVLGEDDRELTLKQMRDYLAEWYPQGLVEKTNDISERQFEDYDRELVMQTADKDEPVFRAIFEWCEPINDNSKVYLSGVVNSELRGIIGKEMKLDDQIAFYNNRDQEADAAKNPAQKGE